MSPPPIEATGTTTTAEKTENLPAHLSCEPDEDDTSALALRFTGWCLWYGKATERWWALSPAWCRERVGLVEADTFAELVARMRHIEDFRPHPASDQRERSRRPLPGTGRRTAVPEPRPESVDGTEDVRFVERDAGGETERDAGGGKSIAITRKGGDRDGRATPLRARRRVR
ncbi:hypothetical protein AB0F88_39360 [Streptosporangium sp. NPDC023963]|uniref:hypothetical protein n=1 Tax=Streptosporangium sp. NPDC023963 TaxID=3155608 RepID=UPI003437D9FF